MKVTQKQSLKNPLMFSQLIYRSVIFSAIMLVLFLLFGKINSRISTNYYLSQLEITETYLYNSFIIFIIWILYLIFVTKDNTLCKLWLTLKLRGTFSDPKEVSVKWYVLFFLAVFPMIISFNITANINSVNDKVIYQGFADIQLVERKNNFDKRFEKVNVSYEAGQMDLYGHKGNIDGIINGKMPVTIYQGVFYKYMIVRK